MNIYTVRSFAVIAVYNYNICLWVWFFLDIIGIGDEIPTYEQVTRLDPDPSLCRPIVLIGAPGVGRRTLIRKLLNSDPSLYQSVVQRKLNVQ